MGDRPLYKDFKYHRTGMAQALVRVPHLEREYWGDKWLSALQNYMDYWIAHTLESHFNECVVRDGGKGAPTPTMPSDDKKEPMLAAQEKANNETTIERARQVVGSERNKEWNDELDRRSAQNDGEDGESLSADYDFFDDKNSTSFMKAYTFKGQKWVTVDMGLTLDLQHNMQPVYAFFCEPTDDEKREFGWLDAEGQVKYIYPGVDWNPRFVLKGFATEANAANKNKGLNFAVPKGAYPIAAPFEGSEEQYDPRIKLHYDHQHILNRPEDENRIRAVYENAGRQVPSASELSMALKDAIEMTIVMARRDFGLARMHCYRDKKSKNERLQFLLPLYLLRDQRRYDLALAVDLRQVKDNDDAIAADKRKIYDPANYTYLAHTVLEPKWAYMNSRLMGRVINAWLLHRHTDQRHDGRKTPSPPPSPGSPDVGHSQLLLEDTAEDPSQTHGGYHPPQANAPRPHGGGYAPRGPSSHGHHWRGGHRQRAYPPRGYHNPPQGRGYPPRWQNSPPRNARGHHNPPRGRGHSPRGQYPNSQHSYDHHSHGHHQSAWGHGDQQADAHRWSLRTSHKKY